MTDKEKYIEFLEQINRRNTKRLIENLDRLNFFISPASSNKHLAIEGGLVKHSLNVCKFALELKNSLGSLDDRFLSINTSSVIVASLLHDICKSDIYLPTVKRQKIDGVWKDVPGYEMDYSRLPLGHGEKSLIMIFEYGYPLEYDEMLAIRWHMYAFDVNFSNFEQMQNFNEANKVPLVRLIQLADQAAAFCE